MYEQVKTDCNMLVGGLLQMLTRPGKYSNITLLAAWDLQDHPRSAARSAAWCLAFMSFKLQWGLRQSRGPAVQRPPPPPPQQQQQQQQQRQKEGQINWQTRKKPRQNNQTDQNWRKANAVKESQMFKCCSRLDRKQPDAEAALLWGKQRKTWNRKH